MGWADDMVRAAMESHVDLSGRIRMLWHSDYWDGPLSGYVQLDGDDGFWVDCIADMWDMRPDDCDTSCTGEDGGKGCPEYKGDRRCRVYLVYVLDDEQRRIRLANHALFREHVGVHTDYDDCGRRPVGVGVKPSSGHHAYYRADLEVPPPLRDSQIVGFTTRLWSKVET